MHTMVFEFSNVRPSKNPIDPYALFSFYTGLDLKKDGYLSSKDNEICLSRHKSLAKNYPEKLFTQP
jgi:hypothetical protein